MSGMVPGICILISFLVNFKYALHTKIFKQAVGIAACLTLPVRFGSKSLAPLAYPIFQLLIYGPHYGVADIFVPTCKRGSWLCGTSLFCFLLSGPTLHPQPPFRGTHMCWNECQLLPEGPRATLELMLPATKKGKAPWYIHQGNWK